MARKRYILVIFSFNKGKIDRWYKQELKKLNDNYYNFDNSNNSLATDHIQESNIRNNQLATATNALKKEYRSKLKEIGEKPRADFLESSDEN